MHIFCDFDGTISKKDTTDLVLTQLADPAWETFEARWISGKITAAECMRGQIALISGDDDALNSLLDTVELADGFVEFVQWCQLNDIALTVVSDGVDRFIARILNRYGLGHLPVVANHLCGDAISGRRLEQPASRSGCAAGSGVCKCQVVSSECHDESLLVFIGDGRSDFCVSNVADLLFAKDKLAAYAHSRAMPYVEFSTFHTITAALATEFEHSVRRAAI